MTKFYTYRREVPKKPGTSPSYLRGKGWYAKGNNATGTSPTPKPKPPTKAQLAAAHEKKVRANSVFSCHYMISNAAKVHYPPNRVRTTNVSKIDTFTKLKAKVQGDGGLTLDCSQNVEVIAHVSGAKCPNTNPKITYANNWATDGYTGTLWDTRRIIERFDVKPGDYVIFGDYTGHHTATFMESGLKDDPLLCSQGSEPGPYAIKLSVEQSYQAAAGHPSMTFFRLPI